MRIVFALVYLGGSVIWAFLSLLAAGLRCDDSCTGAEYARTWTDNVDAWQWATLPWFGLGGLALAAAVVAAVWRLPALARALFALHVAVFALNAVVIGSDSRWLGGIAGWALIFAAAGFALVMKRPSAGPAARIRRDDSVAS